MFLYELAIELGKHSNELVHAASESGMVGVGPATMLDAVQVASLRAQFGVAAGAPPPPPPPGPSSSRPPTPGPVAPPSWGPPPGASGLSPGAAGLPLPAPMRPESPLLGPSDAYGSSAPVGMSIGDEDEPGWSSIQIAVVAAVVVAVVGLFAFMALNSGPSSEQRETAGLQGSTELCASAEDTTESMVQMLEECR
jgi:hypothetical protein